MQETTFAYFAPILLQQLDELAVRGGLAPAAAKWVNALNDAQLADLDLTEEATEWADAGPAARPSSLTAAQSQRLWALGQEYRHALRHAGLKLFLASI